MKERRALPMELRVERADGKTKIVGFAIRYNKLSEDLGGWREMIAPGALDGRTGDDVRALLNHDPNIILGRSVAGTLKLDLRDDGLWVEIDPPETEQARAVVVAIERGDISGQSFSFSLPPMPEGRVWEEDEGGNLTRTVTKIARLYDISPVVFPAYPDTDVSVRSAQDALAEAKELMAREARPTPNFAAMRRRLEVESL